jgi:hypothetical protein
MSVPTYHRCTPACREDDCHMYMCICMCMYVCMYVYTYIYQSLYLMLAILACECACCDSRSLAFMGRQSRRRTIFSPSCVLQRRCFLSLPTHALFQPSVRNPRHRYVQINTQHFVCSALFRLLCILDATQGQVRASPRRATHVALYNLRTN